MSSLTTGYRGPPPRYTAVAIGLHWAMAMVLIGLILVGWNMGDLPDSDPMKKTLYQMHKSVGVTVLFLTLARLIWRFLNPPPPPPPMPDWQHRASEAVHWAFYALMVLMPLTGWILVSASPLQLPTVLFGIAGWPHIPGLPDLDAATRKNLAPILHNAHGKLAWVMLPLLGLHVAAALKHQFVDRDGLIARMAPKLFGASLRPVRPARGAWLAFGGSVLLLIVISAMEMAVSSGTDVADASGRTDGFDDNWLVHHPDSSLGFSGIHEGRRFEGRFTNWRSHVRFEEGNDPVNKVVVRIDMSSARTGDSYYDRTLISKDWFDASAHPEAIFTSSAMRGLGDDSYDVEGVLNIKGRDHALTVPAMIAIEDNTALVRLTFELDRIALGIGVSSDPTADWVGRIVTVSVRLQAHRIAR